MGEITGGWGLRDVKQRLRRSEERCRDRRAMGMTLIGHMSESPITDSVDIDIPTFPHRAGAAGQIEEIQRR
ncbi:MAG: hypothetical protein OXE84_11435 [Rhodobacteraceae bacterium]|nr:hypothetical protein [Paracoccaceae bacterium]MCY4197156.1 hypothetical protein [Paracoccaceae bacterium]